MKYIIFSEFNRNYFLFLSYFIIFIIREIINYYFELTDDIIELFIKCYFNSLSDFLSIIPLIIIKVRSKSNQKKELKELSVSSIDESLNEIKYLHSDSKRLINNKQRIIRLEFFISIFEFLAIYLDVIFKIILIIVKRNLSFKRFEMTSVFLFNIIAKYLLSVVVLHSIFYKHHYFSLIIHFIFLIVLEIHDQLHIFKENDWIILFSYNILKIIVTILYSIEDVYAKVLFSFSSISPYIYLFYRGIFVNIFALIFSIIFIFVDIPDENGNNSCVYTRFWKIYENKLNILYSVLLVILNFIYNVNIFFIIDKFTPSHFGMASILENFGLLLISTIVGRIKIPVFFIRLIIYLILIFAASIYNELIILKVCGLHLNTKTFLEKSSKEDIMQIFLNNDSRYNSEIEEEKIELDDDMIYN